VNDLRLWIALLCLTCFAAGAGLGVFGTARALAVEPPRGAFADYEELLSRRFELSPDRRRLLGQMLEAYERDVSEIKDRRSAELMSAIEPDLAKRGRYYRDLIQTKVLPENRRAEFARLAQLPTPPR
jgi:hypothetical protein